MVDKRTELNSLLLELAKPNIDINEQKVNEYIARLKQIYQDGFRHRYSDIFSTLAGVEEAEIYKLETLVENIRTIHDRALEIPEDSQCPKFKLNIEKLYDHVNLDFARIGYTKRVAEKWNTQWSHSNENLAERIKKLANKAENMQREYVTILGIFSAIVVTFVAGVVFSGSVLNNIGKVSIYRLTFVMIMIALFLMNLLAMLMDFIKKINQRGLNIPQENTNSKEQSVIYNINAMLIILLVIDVIWWGIYWFRFS